MLNGAGARLDLGASRETFRFCVTLEQTPDLNLVTAPLGSAAEALPTAGASQMEPGDIGLMALVGKGDVAAFSTLVERYSPPLYRVACRMLGDAQEAEDAVQDSFTRLWQSAPGWSAKGGGLVAWLHRVLVNRCLDRLRRFRIVTTETLPDVADTTPSPERSLAIRRLEQAIGEALSSLPDRHRAAIVLCYFEGLSNALAAQVLDLNLKAMESLLFRARRSLRELLEQQGVRSEDLELLE